MNIISIDLPWSAATKGRRALAIAGQGKKVTVLSAKDDAEMVALVKKYASAPALVLLDVSIEGCDSLNGKHFRRVDKALQRLGIPLLPSSHSGSRGKDLKERLNREIDTLTVYEMYPYATYKFLACLYDSGLSGRLNSRKHETLLNEDFVRYWPPRYKREQDRTKRLEHMRYLHSLFVDTTNSLGYTITLPYPEASSRLDKLGDEYDACLGLIAGLHYVSNSPYACLVGQANSGQVLLLADRWLSERLKQEVAVSNVEKPSNV